MWRYGAMLVTLLLMPAAAWGACPPDPAVALAAACPCTGKTGPSGVVPWKNAGQYTTCVVKFRNQLRKGRCITPAVGGEMVSCAAQSTCGKRGSVLCCLRETGTCVDPTPTDGIPGGSCSNEEDKACTTDADCTLVNAIVAKSPTVCTTNGGTPAGQGSVCTATCAP